MTSISDEARINMLSTLTLTEPQLLSNVDLMTLVLNDPLQTLIVKTEATAAIHLERYLKSLRSS